jgi:hypothetical protein
VYHLQVTFRKFEGINVPSKKTTFGTPKWMSRVSTVGSPALHLLISSPASLSFLRLGRGGSLQSHTMGAKRTERRVSKRRQEF